MSEEEVDVAELEDKARAQEIYERLKAAGVRHVGFWPEHMLGPHPVLRVDTWRIDEAYPQDHLGPFHIRVRERDVARARFILSSTGLEQS
jgi:hypothetical protein